MSFVIQKSSLGEEDVRIIRDGVEVLVGESEAIRSVSNRIDANFAAAVRLLAGCGGKVVTSGVGKSGIAARKLAATLCSMGMPTVFLHPADAFHGDVGVVARGDVLVVTSASGASDELLGLITIAERRGVHSIAIVGRHDSRLGASCTCVVEVAVAREADPEGIVPSSSTVAAIALGDALAFAAMKIRGFSRTAFAQNHPGGILGKRLSMTVRGLMQPLDRCARVVARDSFSDCLIEMTRFPVGAALVLDGNDRLIGLVTEGDLRRAIQEAQSGALGLVVEEVMSHSPRTVAPTTLAVEALRTMESGTPVYVLPVVEGHHCMGILRMHDVVAAGLVGSGRSE